VTNEELETTNEELEASNQELETINEELAATNEELQTINAELRQRGGELAATTSILDAVLDNAPAGIAVLDAAGRIQVWNAAMERISRIDAGAAVGRRLGELDVAFDRAALLSAIAASLRASDRGLDAPRQAGEKGAYEVRVAPLGGTRNGGVVVFVGEVH
jgi:two-component system CheB/CheR fusion protein